MILRVTLQSIRQAPRMRRKSRKLLVMSSSRVTCRLWKSKELRSKKDTRKENVRSTLPHGRVPANLARDVLAARTSARTIPSAKGPLDLAGADDHGKKEKSALALLRALPALRGS